MSNATKRFIRNIQHQPTTYEISKEMAAKPRSHGLPALFHMPRCYRMAGHAVGSG